MPTPLSRVRGSPPAHFSCGGCVCSGCVWSPTAPNIPWTLMPPNEPCWTTGAGSALHPLGHPYWVPAVSPNPHGCCSASAEQGPRHCQTLLCYHHQDTTLCCKFWCIFCTSFQAQSISKDSSFLVTVKSWWWSSSFISSTSLGKHLLRQFLMFHSCACWHSTSCLTRLFCQGWSTKVFPHTVSCCQEILIKKRK